MRAGLGRRLSDKNIKRQHFKTRPTGGAVLIPRLYLAHNEGDVSAVSGCEHFKRLRGMIQYIHHGYEERCPEWALAGSSCFVYDDTKRG